MTSRQESRRTASKLIRLEAVLLIFSLLFSLIPRTPIYAVTGQYADPGDSVKMAPGLRMNIRREPNTTSGLFWYAENDEVYLVQERVTGEMQPWGDQWYKVYYAPDAQAPNGFTGYLSADVSRQIVIPASTGTPTPAPTPSPTPAVPQATLAKVGDSVEVRNSNGYSVRAYATSTSERYGVLSQGYKFTVTNVVTGDAHAGGNRWYQLNYNGNVAYVMVVEDSTKQLVTVNTGAVPTPVPPKPTPTPGPGTVTPTPGPGGTDPTPGGAAYTAAEWEAVLNSFPASYRESLNKMHQDHPNWKFVPYNHDFSLEYAVDVELQVPARNLTPNWPAYRNMSDTRMYDAGGWYAISRDGLLFTMDPRNWLNDKYVFMFEKLTDTDNGPSDKRLQNLFAGNSDLLAMIPDIISASNAHRVSAVFVGTRIKTEVATGSTIINSAKGELSVPQETLTLLGIDADTSQRYYNVFNIGAYQGSSPRTNGILFAMGYDGGTPTSAARMQELMLPWTSQYRAIYGGIAFIKNSYIGVG